MKIMPITEASRRGISGLIALVEAGDSVKFSRDGKVIAELVSAGEMDLFRSEQEAMRVMARFATDSGARTSLDDVIKEFGFSRDGLEAESR